MIKNIKTNEVYENRLEAKQKMGHANFNRALKNKELILVLHSDPLDVII